MSGPNAVRKTEEPLEFIGIYDRNFRRVYNFVRYLVRGAAEADDLTAAVFEKALRGWAGYRLERGSVEDWLFAIARNTVRDHARRGTGRARVSLETVSEPVCREEGPEGLLIREETRREILRAVLRLGAREREIVALKFAAGLSNRSIAAVSGIREGHVAVILYRAVRRLRAMLVDREVAS